LNGERISYTLVDDEVCITHQEILRLISMGLPIQETNIERVLTTNGVYYYPLKNVCNAVGMISANKTESSLDIKLDLARISMTIWSNAMNLQENDTITVYILNSKGTYDYKFVTYPATTYNFFVRPGYYTIKTENWVNYNESSGYQHTGNITSYETTRTNNYNFYWQKTITAQAGDSVIVDMNDECIIREYPDK